MNTHTPKQNGRQHHSQGRRGTHNRSRPDSHHQDRDGRGLAPQNPDATARRLVPTHSRQEEELRPIPRQSNLPPAHVQQSLQHITRRRLLPCKHNGSHTQTACTAHAKTHASVSPCSWQRRLQATCAFLTEQASVSFLQVRVLFSGDRGGQARSIVEATQLDWVLMLCVLRQRWVGVGARVVCAARALGGC